MRSGDLFELNRILNNNNACVLTSNDEVDFSEFKIFTSKQNNTIPILIEISCMNIFSIEDLSTILYNDFLLQVSQIADFDSINNLTNKIESTLLSKLGLNNNIVSSQFFEYILSELEKFIKTQNDLINFSFPEKKHLELYIIFKDFEFLDTLESNNLWELRAVMQNHKDTHYIITINGSSLKIFDSDNAFYKYFQVLSLEEDLSVYIREYFYNIRDIKIIIENDLIEYIIWKVGERKSNINFLLNIIEADLFTEEFAHNLFTIDKIMLTKYLKEYVRLKTPFFKERVKEIRKIKHGLQAFKSNELLHSSKNNTLLKTMYRELNLIVHRKNYLRILRAMEGKGFLKRVRHGIYISSEPIFSDYVLRNITEEYIKTDIDQFNSKKESL